MVSRTHDNARGFSLPEMLGVIAVAGIAASMAVPAYHQLVRGDRQATAANELVGTLLAARAAALTRNLPVVVCPSTDGRACGGPAWEQGWIAFTDRDGNGAPGEGDNVIATVPAQAGLAIRSPELSPSLSYRPGGAVRGAAGTSGGVFRICTAGARDPGRLVVVPPGGEPRVVQQLPGGVRPACEEDAA